MKANPDTSRCAEAPPPQVLRGLEQFNRREFFECHESIEEAWIPEKDDIRMLWQGILQIGVAFYHVQRGKWKPALTMIGRGLPKVRPFAPACQGIEVDRLIAQTERAEAHLRSLGPTRVGEFDPALFPTIRWRPLG